jgi:F0F1-type ATP synthase delta subunit
LQTHHFGTQKLILVTAANIDIKKYDKFKDGSGNAVQNFLQGYLEQKRIKARKEITAATSNELAQFKGHIHIETKDKTKDALQAEGMQAAEKIKIFLAGQ